MKGDKKLTAKQQKFCELLALGASNIEAHRGAGYADGAQARKHACLRAKEPKIVAEVERLTAGAEKRFEATRDEIVMWLTEVMRTPVGAIDENHPLAQEYREEVGETSAVKIVKMVPKIQAVQLLAKILGVEAPVQIHLGGMTEMMKRIRGRVIESRKLPYGEPS